MRFKRTADIDRDVLRELIAEAGRIGPPPASYLEVMDIATGSVMIRRR